MHIKTYLPFLPGFPVPNEYSDLGPVEGTPWYCLGEKKSVLLTPESIRLANYGWNELQKFPRVFPQAVDDCEAWRRVVPWILEKLGKSVHGKTKLPESIWSSGLGFHESEARHALELEKSEPKLNPLLDAAGWLNVLQPDRAAPILNWFESEREKIVNILENWPGIDGIELVLILFRMFEEDGSNRIAPIIETLGTKNARSISMPSDDFRKSWNEVLSAIAQRTRTPISFEHQQKEFKMRPPDKPEGAWADAVNKFVKQVADQPRKQRRLSLELFAEYIPSNLLERWRLWWIEFEPVARDAEKLLGRVRKGTFEDNEKRSRLAKKIQRRFGELFHIAPPSLEFLSFDWVLELFFQWDSLAWKPYLNSIRSLTRTLSIDHRRKAPRLKALVNLHYRLLSCDYITESELNISMILDEMRNWDIPRHSIPYVIDMNWHRLYAGTREELKRIGKALRYWFVDLEQSAAFDHIVLLVKGVEDETRISRFSRVLARSEHLCAYYWDSMILTAALLAENEKEFEQILAHLKKIEWDETDSIGGVQDNIYVLSRVLAPTAWRENLRGAFLNGEISEIIEIAESVAAIEKRKDAVPLPETLEPADIGWIERYPRYFDAVLRELASLSPEAERIASQKLESTVFDPDDIAAEIQTLEERIARVPGNAANPRILKRIENLRERLKIDVPAEPTESRLRKLHKKLSERTRRIFFERLRNSCRELLERLLCRELDITEFPDSWRDSLRRSIVLGILELETKPLKRLGIKLLRSLAGETSWDYRNEIGNTTFLDRLKKRGIVLESWLSPDEPERIVHENSPPLRLGFENDPMEVMKMGAIFGTCLSPWECNFFSTLANVLDINKQVLYARDSKGAIKARCLVALTDDGELLAFHAYAHDNKLGFRDIVSDYLERLAKRMNTVVVNEGRVSNLVSPEWYDDGAIEISGLFSFLKDGTEFRNSLPNLEPAELISVLEKELSPNPLRTFILPPFLALKEVKRRPELVLPLIPYFSSALSGENMSTMIKYVVLAGEKREAARLTKQYLIPRLERMFSDEYWTWRRIAFGTAEIVPDVFLPYIRRLGGRGTKKLDEDGSADRRSLLVLIYEALGRKRKASLVSG